MRSAPTKEKSFIVQRSFSIDTLGTLFTSILTILFSIPLSILIARYLGPEGKGILTIVLLVVSQIELLLSLGVETALIYYGGRRPDDIGNLTSLSLGLGIFLGLAGLGSAIAIFAILPYNMIPSHLLPFLIIFSSTIPMVQLTTFLRSIMRISGRILEEGFLGMVGVIFNLIATGVILLVGFQIKGVLIGIWLSTALITFLIFVLMSYWNILNSRPIFSILKWKPLIAYGIKLHIGSVFQALNYRFDIFLVAYFLGSAQVGLYSVAITIGEWLWLIPKVLGVSLMQRVAKYPEEDVNRMVGVINRLTSILLFLGILVLALVGSYLIRLFYGETFSASYLPLLLLLPGIWALGLWKNFINDLSVRGYPAIKSYTSGIALILTVILDIFLIPRWGITGAAIASSSAYLIAWWIALKAFCRITNYHPLALLLIRWQDIVLAINLFKGNLRYLQASWVTGGNVGT